MVNTMDSTLDHARKMAANLKNCDCSFIVQIALKELGLPSHREGFYLTRQSIRILCSNPLRTLANGIYTEVAHEFNFPEDDRLIDQAIQAVIKAAWNQRDEKIWNCYFPVGRIGRTKCPSNKEFMMAVVDFIELWKAFCEEARDGHTE